MGENALKFFLGLSTFDFLKNIGGANAAVEALTLAAEAGFEAMEYAWDHMVDAMDVGVTFQNLSNETGESVARLAQFQHGLEAVGGSAENLSMFFLMAQRSMSGFTENGQRTDLILSQLGLDFNKLRGEDTVKMIEDVATALGKINPGQRAGIAETLFGRGGAQQLLEITNNLDGFKEAMQKGALTGELLGEFAKVFKQVKNDADDIENDFLGIWVQLAGKIAPAMHAILADVDSFVRTFSEAFKEGKLGELIKLELIVGIEYAGSFLMNLFGSAELWQGIFDVMKGEWMIAFAAIEQYFVTWAVTMDTLLQWVVQQFGNKFGGIISQNLALLAKGISLVDPIAGGIIAGLSKAAGAIPNQGTSFSTLYAQNDAAVNGALGSLAPGNVASKGLASIVQGTQEELGAVYDAWKNASAKDAPKLAALYQQLLKNAANPGAVDPGTTGTANLPGLGENHYKPEFTALEKMGFIMSGSKVQNPMDMRKVDLLLQIVHNTASLHPTSLENGGPLSKQFNKIVDSNVNMS